jgi:hypothetical protein
VFAPKPGKARFDFVSVSEFPASGVPAGAPECHEMKQGGNLRDDSRWAVQRSTTLSNI